MSTVCLTTIFFLIHLIINTFRAYLVQLGKGVQLPMVSIIKSPKLEQELVNFAHLPIHSMLTFVTYIIYICSTNKEISRKAKKSKVEMSMGLLKETIEEQSNKQISMLEAMQTQWLNLEAQRMEQEERERIREREHELKMMEMFGAMFNQANSNSTKNGTHSSTYTEMHNTLQPHNLSSYFNFN